MTIPPTGPPVDDELDGWLRATRPEPTRELVGQLVGSITGPERRRTTTRTLVAAGFSVVVLGALSLFGGIGYAASHTNAFVHTTFAHPEHAEPVSAADDQYRPGKGCGDRNHVHVPKPGQPPCPHEDD